MNDASQCNMLSQAGNFAKKLAMMTLASDQQALAAVLPFEINQAVVGLGLEKSDEAVLSYLNFLGGKVPIQRASFIHVLPKVDIFNAFYESESEGIISNFELDQDVAKRLERDIRHRLGQSVANITCSVQEGDPLEALLLAADQTHADLVVIGQHPEEGPHGILARNLARKVHCAALFVPHQSPEKLERIIVPVDFSDHSVKALQAAVSLAYRFGNKVEIEAVNVYELPNISAYRINKTREELKEVILEGREQAFKVFLDSHLGPDAEKIKTTLIEREWDSVANYLLHYAENANADLLIMGAKGHSRVELLLMGSVTENLLTDNERTPVLVVK